MNHRTASPPIAAQSRLPRQARAVDGLALVALAVLALLGASVMRPAQAQQIYTCTDASGKKLTSDRPIAECSAREQRVLNADGSVRRIVAPTPTAEERGEIEAREGRAAAERAARQEAIRRDRNLLARYPNEAAHRKAREAALDDASKALRLAEARIVALAAERKPLTAEAEFYVGKPLPPKLKTQLDANEAMVEAQRRLTQGQELEIARIEKGYDIELERLRKLWGGASPGSLGVMADAAASAPPRK